MKRLLCLFSLLLCLMAAMVVNLSAGEDPVEPASVAGQEVPDTRRPMHPGRMMELRDIMRGRGSSG